MTFPSIDLRKIVDRNFDIARNALYVPKTILSSEEIIVIHFQPDRTTIPGHSPYGPAGQSSVGLESAGFLFEYQSPFVSTHGKQRILFHFFNQIKIRIALYQKRP